MAIRANAAGDRISRTTSLPDPRNVSMVGRFYIDSDLGSGVQQVFWELFSPTNYNIAIFHEGMRLKMWNGNEVFGTTLSLATWYDIAVVASSAGAWAYLDGLLDITLGAPVNTAVGSKMAFLNNPTGDQHGDHRCEGLKLYDALLTQGDIKYERQQILPRRVSLLYGAWPCRDTADITDYSDGGHDLTAEGTLDTVTGSSLQFNAPPDGSLRVCIKNRRYVSVDGVTPMMIAGGHTWNNLVDISGTGFPPAAWDATTYYETGKGKGWNAIRGWGQDFSRTDASYHTNDFYAPFPWARTGPGNAADGGLKFDFNTWDTTYWTKLRAQIEAAAARGEYYSVMMWEAYMARNCGPTWIKNGHPMTSGNNINGISADVNADGFIEEAYTRTVAGINTIQDALIAKFMDETYNYWNVLYEPANELVNSANSVAFQVYVIDQIRLNEINRPSPYRHLIWRSPQGGGSTDDSANVLASGADLFGVALGWSGYTTGPFVIPEMTAALAAWGPRIFDTDHMGDSNIDAMWKAAMRGYHTFYMDDPSGVLASPPGGFPDDNVRTALGDILSYSRRVLSATATPNSAMCSTGYALSTVGSKYLFYQPSSGAFTGDLSGAPGVTFKMEWHNTNNGAAEPGGTVIGGSATTSFTPPYTGVSGVVLMLEAVTASTRVVARQRKRARHPAVSSPGSYF